MTRASAAALSFGLISSLLLSAPAFASPTTDIKPGSVAAEPAVRPFAGVRFFYVPSQKRYRAVKFSPKAAGRPAGSAAGAYSNGPGGASCFNGEKRGSTYIGTLYSLPSGPTYTRSYTLNDLFFGQQTYTVPTWFKRKARGYLNGNGSCAVW